MWVVVVIVFDLFGWVCCVGYQVMYLVGQLVDWNVLVCCFQQYLLGVVILVWFVVQFFQLFVGVLGIVGQFLVLVGYWCVQFDYVLVGLLLLVDVVIVVVVVFVDGYLVLECLLWLCLDSGDVIVFCLLCFG